MNSHRKSATNREKDLRLAILRIERGRARTKATKLSISAVAREAGVSAALIHNHYPLVAEAIRVKQGTSTRAQRDAHRDALRDERKACRALRDQVREAERRLAVLASLNETLIVENQGLRAQLATRNVSSLADRRQRIP